MPLVFTLYEMEKNGVKIASDELHAYGQMLGEKEKELEESIYEMAGEVFNINSPKQLGVILFEKMELPNGKEDQDRLFHGSRSSGEAGVRIIRSWQTFWNTGSVAKLKSTYADGLANLYCSRTDGSTANSIRP